MTPTTKRVLNDGALDETQRLWLAVELPRVEAEAARDAYDRALAAVEAITTNPRLRADD